MITNEVQYRATKAHLERFEEAAANIEDRPGKRTKLERLELDAGTRPGRRSARRTGRLRRASRRNLVDVRCSFVGGALDGARQGTHRPRWTQRQLAEALGMAEQQIQRYEANDYRSTSLARLCDIANALGVTVAQHAELKPSAA